jgi:2-octaprenyl-6-methoxyphenol hydroxylase
MQNNPSLQSNNVVSDYDVVIVGAGLAGTCLALALAKLDLNILVVEQFPANHSQQPSFDDRAIAVNLASIQFLKWIDLWPTIAQSTQPIENIHISNQGHFGFSRLNCKMFGLDAFGHVVENRVVGLNGHQLLEAHPNIKLMCPATIKSISNHETDLPIKVTIDTLQNSETQTFTARWLIAADGINSKVRQLCGGEVEVTDYHTKAIITNITTQKDHANRAFERFTTSGPLALLPMTDNRISVVWAVTHQHWQHLIDLNNAQFIKALQEAFGFRLGHITHAGRRQSYPLVQSVNQSHACGRVIFVANSAQSLHPIAGQGFNLGLRDIAQLVDSILTITQQSLADNQLAELYSSHRQSDQRQLIDATNGLLSLFSNEYPLLTESRNMALNLFDLCQISQKAAVDFFTGANGKLPAWLWQQTTVN